MIDPRKLGQLLLGEWKKTEQPLKERGSVLPIGEYEDGSVGLAWPALLNTPYEALRNFGSHGYGEDAVPYNARQAFDAAGLAMTGGLGVGLAGGMVDNALGSAGGKLTQSASDLPMDLASRMARAREIGFDTETPFYHNTKSPTIDAFRPSKDGGLGPGVYFGKDPSKLGQYGPRTEEVYVRGELAPPELLQKITSGYMDAGDPVWLARKKAFADIQATGNYSGINGGDHWQQVVFDPRNIRSVNAAFDPAQSDSANLLAASAPTGAAVPLAMQAQQDTDINPALLEYLRLTGLY